MGFFVQIGFKIWVIFLFFISQNVKAGFISFAPFDEVTQSCDDWRMVTRALNNEALPASIDSLNAKEIIYLQEDRDKMVRCVIASGETLTEILAGKYKDNKFSELLGEAKKSYLLLKEDQAREWKEYLFWQDNHKPSSITEDEFNTVRDAAIARWHKQEHGLKKWVLSIDKMQDYVTMIDAQQCGNAKYFLNLINWANNRIKKIDNILNFDFSLSIIGLTQEAFNP